MCWTILGLCGKDAPNLNKHQVRCRWILEAYEGAHKSVYVTGVSNLKKTCIDYNLIAKG